MFKVERRKKYLSNCETAFCQCNHCIVEGEKITMTAFPVEEQKKKVRRFTCCEHGVHPRQCTKCQIEAFEKVSLNSLTKDVRGLLCGIIASAPLEKLYCCRCETGFHIMTIEELNNNSCCLYTDDSIHAEKCDCRIFFVGNRVLIVADEFSDYGDDGFSMTAGIFADPASGVTLPVKQEFTASKRKLWFAITASISCWPVVN
jgi:hypothetical protein